MTDSEVKINKFLEDVQLFTEKNLNINIYEKRVYKNEVLGTSVLSFNSKNVLSTITVHNYIGWVDFVLIRPPENDFLINISFSFKDEPEKVDEYLEKFRKILLES